MRLLLDTHVALWWFNDPARLRAEVVTGIEDPANDAILSAASIWEAGLKQAAGKLNPPRSLEESARIGGLVELAVTWAHASAAASLPRLHGDPFDRMLVAQAQVESLVLVTRDPFIRQYDVQTMAA